MYIIRSLSAADYKSQWKRKRDIIQRERERERERERDKSGGEFVNYLHNNIKKDFWQTEGKRIIFYYYNLLRRVFIYLEDKWMISTWSLLNTISRYRLLSSDIHGGIIQWNYVLVSSFLFFFFLLDTIMVLHIDYSMSLSSLLLCVTTSIMIF